MALTGLNITFPIKNADGTAFHNLVLRKATVNSVVMSLGDKITGDVYYKDNTLAVTMQEYIEYDGVRYSLVNPPTIVREGMVSDNSELKGMTKYSFEFYHPMYMLGNFPFSDIAVNSSQEKYLSQNKTFSWIGYLADFVAKINKNLEGTQWIVVIGSSVQQDILTKLSDVLSFDNTTIADALKTGYETWEVPYVVDTIASDSAYYAQGKRFMVQYGLPTTEIVDGQGNPFVFHFGKGVGLKNNSRTPRNNKIITRIAGYGSENNIPYGYPQIVWTGNQDWDYTINNDPTAENSYPIYKGIVGGAYVKLIKHPFTRTHLMPSIYSETVNKKVNPYAIGYDPTTEIKDYYDADNTYDNPIKDGQPSYEIHAFEDIKPELTSAYSLQAVVPYDQHAASQDFVTKASFLGSVLDRATSTEIALERAQMLALYNSINNDTAYNSSGSDDSYEYSCATTSNSGYFTVTYKSSNFNFTSVIQITQQSPEWDDTMDEDGNYVQSYFQITLPQLTFDIYACAAITEEMKINMRSGACIGCTFPVQVDWDDYKKNFYDSDGNFAPTGAQRDYTKYPDSSQGTITILVQKENDTFGTLMPNIYQKPQSGDKFVILGISLPLSYITSAESRLDDEMKAYMRENNVYYYDYPLKFDEHFLATYTSVLNQMKNNVLVRFDYAGTQHALYIKQMTVKYGDNPLPQYDITLTDDIEVVLNQIGQAVEDISNLHSLLSEQQQKTLSLSELDARYIRKDIDDDAAGIIRFVRGMQVGERFVTGLLGEGGIFRRDADGKTYIEADKLYIRMKAYFDTVEIRKYQHSSGNRIASNAGIRCSRVEYIDSNGNITTNVASANIFRCYFKASEDDKTITNDFVVGDLAFCSETNVNTGGLSQHRYWRAVVDKSLSADSNGEHYIDLSVSDCETGSGIPIAQDDIVQLGNKTDTTRQGAIIEFVSGGDAPSYQIYQGINTYSLNNKNYIGMGYSSSTGRAYLNVYGDFRFGSRDNNGSYITYNASDGSLNIKAIINAQSTIGSQSIPDYIKANQNNYNDAWVHSAIDDLQSQIDGEIDSWFYNYLPVANLDSKVPLTNKEPYKTWYEADAGGTQSEVTTERTKHLGDTFYDNSSGYAFRFSLNENTNAFEWNLITDSAVVQALANAAKAQETADGKRATYSTWGSWVKNGVNTLKQGDLFIPASDYTDTSVTPNVTYKARKVYKCTTDGQNAFSEINYTDDTELNNFINVTYVNDKDSLQGQIDGKIESWFVATDPESSWYNPQATPPLDNRSKHVGDMWYNPSTHLLKRYTATTVNETTTYSWGAIEDQKAIDAYANAATAQDTADGKRRVFVSQPTDADEYDVGDIWVNATYGSIYSNDILRCQTHKDENTAFNIGHWTKASKYTDDTYAHGFDFLTSNLARLSSTQIDGGLVLSSLIGLRDTNNDIQSGINGIIDSTKKGNGIAAWYGGEQGDLEDAEHYTNITRKAKSLFRFDGSGYLASGNITWNANGAVTIKNITTLSDSQNTNLLNELATFNSAFTFTTSGQGSTTALSITPNVPFTRLLVQSNNTNYAVWHGANHPTTISGYGITDAYTKSEVYTKTESDGRFITKEFFETLFNALDSSGVKVNANSTLGIASIKAMFGFWTEQYISALGQNSSGGGGGGTGDVTWDLLANNSDTRQIALSHLTNALSGYATTSQLANYLPLTGGTLTGNLIIGGSDLPELADNLGGYASLHSVKFYRNGFLIPYQADNTNDGGFFRVRGTTESNCICEIGTWDDSGNGETIQFNYYPTTSTINPTYSVSVPKATGTLALTSDIPTNNNQLTNGAGYITSSALSGCIYQGNVIDTHCEGYGTITLDGTNELYAFYERGGTCDAYEVDESTNLTDENLTRTSTTVQPLSANVFNGIVGYNQDSVYSGDKLAVYDLILPTVYPWSVFFFWSFGGGQWKPAKIRVLTSTGSGSYVSRYSSDDCPTYGKIDVSRGADGIRRVRLVVSWYSRLACIGITYYASNGLSTTYMNKCLDDAVYRNINPAKDNTWVLGNSSLRWKEIRAVNFYGTFNGVATSALNADLLDGYDSSYFVNNGTTWDKTVRLHGYILEMDSDVSGTNNNPFSIIGGNAATVIQNLPSHNTYGAQLAFGFGSARVVYRNRVGSLSNSDWVGIIAGSADKLVTPRTIWGQSFDGTANVSGYMSGVSGIFVGLADVVVAGTMEGATGLGIKDAVEKYGLFEWITGNGNAHLQVTRSDGVVDIYNLIIQELGGNVGIGTTSPSYKLDVNGSLNATSIYENGTALSNKYLPLTGGILTGKLTIGGGTITTSYGSLLELRSYNSTPDSIDWTFAVKNNYNDISNYNLGVGIKLALGGEAETGKWGGISYVGNSEWFNSGKLIFYCSAQEAAYIDYTNFIINKNVGIGTTSPSFKLTVDGYTRTNRLYLTDSVYLEYDSANGGVHVVGAGLYADTYISALGASTGTAGGVGDVTWDALASSSDSRQIAASHLSNVLSGYLPLTGGIITGNLTINSGSNGTSLIIYGESSSGYGRINMDGDGLNFFCTGGANQLYFVDNSYFGGNWVDVDGRMGIGIGHSNTYQLTVNGQVGATGFVNTSDLRKKTIMGDVPINLYNVANAPLFKFTWKDEKEYSGQHIGSAAQYWQTVLPELVIQGSDADMTLAMQYDVIALASVITVAKTVVSHEERITILEKENEALRKEIEKLKAA